MLLRALAACFLLFPAVAFATDNDGDGYHTPEDCDDNDPSINPGAEESCVDNNADSNCDGLDDLDDTDGDGSINCFDCLPENPDARPSIPEACDGIDTDCDPLTDEDADLDEDGYTPCTGDCDDEDAVATPADADEDGQTSCDGDCDDTDPVLNEDDLDGDGETTCDTDCDDSDPAINSVDLDGDGYAPCEATGPGDCDESSAEVSPDADEVCDDGIDNDCSGVAEDLDEDGDGSVSPLCGGPDCDDNNATIAPDLPEEDQKCQDIIDNDCDGVIDDEDPDCFAEPEVHAGIDQQDKYLGGQLVLVFDASETTDDNPSDELTYEWVLDTPADTYPGTTVELVTDPASPYAYLRFSAETGTELEQWDFAAHVVVSDGNTSTDPEDPDAQVTARIFRPTFYSEISCGFAPRAASQGVALLLGLLGLLGLRRRS